MPQLQTAWVTFGKQRRVNSGARRRFKPKDWDYNDRIRSQFPDIVSLDLLIIERAEIQPAFRKQGLGLLAACRTIDVFGANCGLVVMKPFPLQFRNYLEAGWREPDGVENATGEFRTARQRLRRYWARAGFKRVNETDYWALCPGRKRPSLNTIALAIDETCVLGE